MPADRNKKFSDDHHEDKAFVPKEMDSYTKEVVKNLRNSMSQGIKNDLKILEQYDILRSSLKNT